MIAGKERVSTIKSAINFIFATWNAVETIFIQNCFQKSKFKHRDVNPPENDIVAGTNVDRPSSLSEQLFETSCNFVNVEEKVETVPELTKIRFFKK